QDTRDPFALKDRPGRGRPNCWTPELRHELKRALRQPPDAWGYKAVEWTVPLLIEHLDQTCRVRLSDDTVRRELTRIGYVWKRTRYALEPDPDAEKKTPNSTEIGALGAADCALGPGRDRPPAVPAPARRMEDTRPERAGAD